MKTALWIYFCAITLLCVLISTAIDAFGTWIPHQVGVRLSPGSQMMVDYKSVLYAIPFPSLVLAIRGISSPERKHLVAAYSFAVLAILVSVCLVAFFFFAREYFTPLRRAELL